MKKENGNGRSGPAPQSPFQASDGGLGQASGRDSSVSETSLGINFAGFDFRPVSVTTSQGAHLSESSFSHVSGQAEPHSEAENDTLAVSPSSNRFEPKTMSFIRGAFVMTQALSSFCIFFSSVLVQMNSEHDAHTAQWYHYLVAGVVATSAAVLEGYTVNYFQGRCIDDEDEIYYDALEYQPRTWKSNVVESGFLVLSSAVIIAENIFAFSAIKAFILTLTTERSISIAALSSLEIAFIALLTMGCEAPFELTNGWLESGKQIKTAITHSATASLTGVLAKLLACRAGRIFIKYVGTATHVLGHVGDAMLLIPAPVYLYLYEHSEAAFAAIISVYAALLSFMFIFNVIQTYSFETLTSLQNLRELEAPAIATEETSLLNSDNGSVNPNGEKIRVSRRSIYTLFKVGLIAQGPFHGISDAAVWVVFIRMFVGHQAIWVQALAMAPALLQLGASACGNHKSEVKESLENLVLVEKHSGEEKRLT